MTDCVLTEVEKEQESLAGKRHWPAPWTTFAPGMVAGLNDLRSRKKDGVIVGNSFGNTTQSIVRKVAQTDADRIVACVNALEDVDDPAALVGALRKFLNQYEVLCGAVQDSDLHGLIKALVANVPDAWMKSDAA